MCDSPLKLALLLLHRPPEKEKTPAKRRLPTGSCASNSRDYHGVTVETFGPFIQSYIGILSYSINVYSDVILLRVQCQNILGKKSIFFGVFLPAQDPCGQLCNTAAGPEQDQKRTAGAVRFSVCAMDLRFQ
jgi:hypothetical protein